MFLRRAFLFALLAVSALMPEISYSADIKVLSANGMREVMEDLRPKFERATGHQLVIVFATVGVIVQRITSGEIADAVGI